jgi:hypothetical protein
VVLEFILKKRLMFTFLGFSPPIIVLFFAAVIFASAGIGEAGQRLSKRVVNILFSGALALALIGTLIALRDFYTH